jgi:hypothetical protein
MHNHHRLLEGYSGAEFPARPNARLELRAVRSQGPRDALLLAVFQDDQDEVQDCSEIFSEWFEEYYGDPHDRDYVASHTRALLESVTRARKSGCSSSSSVFRDSEDKVFPAFDLHTSSPPELSSSGMSTVTYDQEYCAVTYV